MAVCPQCTKATSSILALRLHLLVDHKLKVEISTCSFSCKESNCYRSFANWKVYRRHLVMKHSVPLQEFEAPSPVLNAGPILPPNNDPPPVVPLEQPPEILPVPPVPEVNSINVVDSTARIEDAIRGQVVGFCQKLYSNKSFCRSDVNSICTDVNNLIATSSKFVQTAVVNELRVNESSDTVISKVEGFFSPLENSFSGLSSDHLRRKVLTQSGCLVEPEEFVIGSSDRAGPNFYQPAVPDKGARIPLKKLLTTFFSKRHVLDTVVNYMTNVLKVGQHHSTVQNFCQGELWTTKLRTVFRGKDIVIPLNIFSDAFQVNDGFGHHASTGKLEGVYLSIPVLPPELKSRLDHIFIIALVRSEDLRVHGNTAVFQCIVDDLKDLEENGLDIKTPEGVKRVYFSLGLLMGDNLGLQGIMGFLRCFIGNFCCRFCRAPKQLRDHLTKEDTASLRSRQNYREDVLLNDSSQTGILEEAEWNRLPSFHVVENFSADPMHDLSEGCCHYDLAHVLRSFIFGEPQLFTLETLNARLRTFSYAFGKNHPQEISANDINKSKFNMSASEMNTFVRCLGVMIGDLVPENDKRWDLYLSLRHIIDIVTAPVVNDVMILELKDHVEQHHDTYITEFDDNLKFKHHVLIHYPTIMSKIGPISQTSCMRMESKHRDSTVSANATSSRRNPPFTLLLRHQLSLAENFNLAFYGVKSLLKTGTRKLVRIRECDDFDLFASTLPNVLPEILTLVSWVDYKGTKYEPGTCVVIGNDNLGVFPLFGVIKYVFLDDQEHVYIVSKVYFTEFFDNHRFAYAVSAEDEKMSFQNLDSLFDPHPVNLTYSNNGLSYVISHHKL